MKLTSKYLDLFIVEELSDDERVRLANKNSEADMDTFTPKFKAEVDKLFSTTLGEFKKKKVKAEGRPTIKYIAKSDYNGVKNGFTLIVWDNPWSGQVEFNVKIKDDTDKKRDKAFDKGNSIMDKVLKKAEYGRGFYWSDRLGE